MENTGENTREACHCLIHHEFLPSVWRMNFSATREESDRIGSDRSIIGRSFRSDSHGHGGPLSGCSSPAWPCKSNRNRGRRYRRLDERASASCRAERRGAARRCIAQNVGRAREVTLSTSRRDTQLWARRVSRCVSPTWPTSYAHPHRVLSLSLYPPFASH